MIDQPLVFVDVETTGGSYTTDRVIEVGLIRVVDGVVEQEYTTLVNPQRYLPPEITRLTGIEPFELDQSPDFGQLRYDLHDFFEDAVFVAHNVAFDYGFIRSEFRRYGLRLDVKKLCTVKLSRLLYPRYRRHNLDALIDRHGFTIGNRHRALDDARILWQFYQKVQVDLEPTRVRDALTTLLQEPNIPAHLSKQLIESLPEGPGVYVFRNAEGAPLYVGKSMTIRDRVKQHLHAAYSETKKRNMAEETYDIESIPCPGDLSSQLLELRLIRELKPVYNRALRPVSEYVMARKYETKEGYLTVSLEKYNQCHPGKDHSLVRDLTVENGIEPYSSNRVSAAKIPVSAGMTHAHNPTHSRHSESRLQVEYEESLRYFANAEDDINSPRSDSMAKTPASALTHNASSYRVKPSGIEKSTLTEEDLSTPLRSGRDDVNDMNIHGIWKTMKTAKQALAGLAEKHTLCRRLLGLELGQGLCFGYHLGTCKGACVGKELPMAYNMRFAAAFAEVKLKPWPFPGPIQIRQEYEDLQEYLVCDQWQHVGTIRAEDANDVFDQSNGHILVATQLRAEASEYASHSDTTRESVTSSPNISDIAHFDYDMYRILLRFLKREYNRRLVEIF